MKLYKGTGSHVKLIGSLKEVPTLQMDKQGDFFTVISIHINTPDHAHPKQYEIAVLKEAALCIRQYGFPGVYLLVEGEFEIHSNKTQIVSEKVTFLDTSDPDTSSTRNNIDLSIFAYEFQNKPTNRNVALH